MSNPPVTRGAPLLTEMGSSGSFSKSSGNGGSSPPADQSINGLKFGKKIYFEDALLGSGAAAPSLLPSSKSASSSSSSSSRKVQGGQQQPPRCQVEGCKVDLTDAKAYYSRHKVCSMHSKSPKVIVGGLEQRFCQQCSRFHLLPEFDQGKRSCRRRLAGHNERRRKPPSGSVLSSRYGRLSSTMFDGGSRSGGFLLDFSAYPSPRGTGREAWPTARSSEQIPRNQSTVSGRSFAHQWQNSSQNPPSNVYLQASACGTGFSCSVIPSGECSTGVGVTDSSCALSLLSNQSWGSSNRASGVGATNSQGAPMVQSSAPPHGATVTQYPNPSWGFKCNEVGNSSHDMHPDSGLGQISQPLNSQFSGELELLQDNRRQFMELQHSRAYDSPSQHIHWTL